MALVRALPSDKASVADMIKDLLAFCVYRFKRFPYICRGVLIWNCTTMEEIRQIYAEDFARLKREYKTSMKGEL